MHVGPSWLGAVFVLNPAIRCQSAGRLVRDKTDDPTRHGCTCSFSGSKALSSNKSWMLMALGGKRFLPRAAWWRGGPTGFLAAVISPLSASGPCNSSTCRFCVLARSSLVSAGGGPQHGTEDRRVWAALCEPLPHQEVKYVDQQVY
jgi:hypothetical protein